MKFRVVTVPTTKAIVIQGSSSPLFVGELDETPVAATVLVLPTGSITSVNGTVVDLLNVLTRGDGEIFLQQNDAFLRLTDSYASFGFFGKFIQINYQGWVVSEPELFRAAIGIQETFGEYLAAIASTTTDPGIEGKPWNDNGTFKFSTGSFSTYLRPDGFSQIFRPDGVSLYLRP
jgi:hypothetical protein